MRNSVCHSATIYANAIMHAGTTVDTFLRENLVSHGSCLYLLLVSFSFIFFNLCISFLGFIFMSDLYA